MAIQILNPPNIKIRKIVNNTVQDFLKKYSINPQAIVNIFFVHPRKMMSLNNKYRHLNQPTDVLSFPIWENLNEIPKKGRIILGDIFVCADFAQGDITDIIKHSLNHLIGKHH